MKFIKQPNFTPPKTKILGQTRDYIIYYDIKYRYNEAGQKLSEFINNTIAIHNNKLGRIKFDKYWRHNWVSNRIDKVYINSDTFKNLENPPQILI